MNRYLYPVTPAEVSHELSDLCTSLAPGIAPIYVDVRSIEDAPPNECFPIVDKAVVKSGGSSVLGWTLWELPGIFVEAEFHAVWINPTGDLIDLTPKNRPVGRILFLPNEHLVYTGRQVNNVRCALSSAPCVAEYLATFNAEFDILNRGDRAYQHGEIELSDSEAEEFYAIQTQRAAMYPQVLRLAAIIGAYTPCPCNSGKKVKWCHGINNVGSQEARNTALYVGLPSSAQPTGSWKTARVPRE